MSGAQPKSKHTNILWGECAVEHLKALYVDELRDLLDAEKQLIKAIPALAESSTSSLLRVGFEQHLEQTKTHAKRIQQILEALGEEPKANKCKGMRGIIGEVKEILARSYEGSLKDSAIISAAERAEHYEIAAYGGVREYALALGENEAAAVLGQTLEEEKDLAARLTDLARTAIREALEVGNAKSRTVSAS